MNKERTLIVQYMKQSKKKKVQLLGRSLVWCHWEAGQRETKVKKASKFITLCNRVGPNLMSNRS